MQIAAYKTYLPRGGRQTRGAEERRNVRCRGMCLCKNQGFRGKQAAIVPTIL